MRDAQEQRRQQGQDIPIVEWAAAALGLIIVLAAIASLLFQAIRGSGSPPQIDVSVLTVEAQQGAYLVRIRVANTGGSAAAQLVVEGALKPQEGEAQRSQITLDYVPARSQRHAGLLFTSDPNKGKLQVRAIGYQDP